MLVELSVERGGRIYDPACGMATILVAVGEGAVQIELVGHDNNSDLLSLATQPAVLYGRTNNCGSGRRIASRCVVAQPSIGQPWLGAGE